LVAGEVIGAIDRGLVVLLGVGHRDIPADADWLAERICDLRLFADEHGKTNLSLMNVAGAVLVVSQFTLYADARKGRRPSFTAAAPPDVALTLYDRFVLHLRAQGVRVETGRFGADMQVELSNDGPVTLWLEREAGQFPGGG
jgi:D-tyrosyl-tRNA(Tyr) deacylase